MATKLGTLLMFDFYTSDMRMQLWGKSSYARAMIDLRTSEELKDSIVVAMPKRVGVGFNMCIKIISDAVKNLNNPRQATRGVLVGPKGSLNVAHGGSSNSSIIDKIDKQERQILDGTFMFVDNDENPLVLTGNVDSDTEVEVVLDKTSNLMASTSFKGETVK
nr:hypothetical protein [Tanacetum cinerariifolium]